MSAILLKIVSTGIGVSAAAAIGQSSGDKFWKFLWLSVWVWLGGMTVPIVCGFLYDSSRYTLTAGVFAIIGLGILILGRSFNTHTPISTSPLTRWAVHKSAAKLLIIPGILTPLAIYFFVQIGSEISHIPLPDSDFDLNLKRSADHGRLGIVGRVYVLIAQLYEAYGYLALALISSILLGFFGSIALIKRTSPQIFLIVGFAIFCAIAALTPFLDGSWFIIFFLFGVDISVVYVITILTYSILSQSVPPENQGVLMGLRAIIVPLVAGVWIKGIFGFLEPHLHFGDYTYFVIATILVALLAGSIYLARNTGLLATKKNP